MKITQKGLELLKEIDAKLFVLEDTLKSTLTDKEVVQLNKLLDKLLGGYE